MNKQLLSTVKRYLYANGQNSDDDVFATLQNEPHYDIADEIHRQHPKLDFDEIVAALDEVEVWLFEQP